MHDENIRMIKRTCRGCFLLEPAESLFIDGVGGGKNLHRNIPAQLGIARAIHLTHPALANLRADFVTA